jgi:CDP-diacylglycerol---serine O-phosphatidyltransferase
MKQIPNLFTLLNLVFGCLAVIFMLQNGIIAVTGPDGIQYLDIPEKIWLCSLFIGLAAVIDFLDGFVARLFRSTSAMGEQLDSLADLVSFGVAPGIIIYQFLKFSFAQEENGLDVSIIWLLPALVLPCAAAWRLAKFNLDTTQSFSFKGLPTPAAGLFIASFPVIYETVAEDWVRIVLLNKWFLYGVVLLLSVLMVSRLPLMSLKFKNYGWKDNQPKYALALISVAALVLLQWMAIPVIVLAYVLLSLLIKNKIA